MTNDSLIEKIEHGLLQRGKVRFNDDGSVVLCANRDEIIAIMGDGAPPNVTKASGSGCDENSGPASPTNPRDCNKCGLSTRGGPHHCQSEIPIFAVVHDKLVDLCRLAEPQNDDEVTGHKFYLAAELGEVMEILRPYLITEESMPNEEEETDHPKRDCPWKCKKGSPNCLCDTAKTLEQPVGCSITDDIVDAIINEHDMNVPDELLAAPTGFGAHREAIRAALQKIIPLTLHIEAEYKRAMKRESDGWKLTANELPPYARTVLFFRYIGGTRSWIKDTGFQAGEKYYWANGGNDKPLYWCELPENPTTHIEGGES